MSRSIDWYTIYINQADAFGEHTQTIQDKGWKVYNAPRPIPGDLTWISDCRHGVFYAAGSEEMFGQSWEALDAWPVEAIDNTWVYKQLLFKAWSCGYHNLRAFMLSNYHTSIARLANECDFPWRDEPFTVPEAAAVELYQISDEQRWSVEKIIPGSIPGQLSYCDSNRGLHTLVYTFSSLDNAKVFFSMLKELGISARGDWQP